MGVHGLTTYLREHKRVLSKVVELTPKPINHPVSIVVDGWSFIYDLYNNSSLPWVYGGEYPEFAQIVTTVVEAWIKVGLKIYFVFDGAYPDLKFPTLISRLSQSHIQHALLFFRTSAISRQSPRSLHETRILPPLVYTTCIGALKNLQCGTNALEIHFADEEGDPYAVELASRVGGYVVGNDSDFIVLNAEGYLGYIPMDEMVWKTPSLLVTPLLDGGDDDFQVVCKPKNNRKHVSGVKAGRGLVPPLLEELELHVNAYSPVTLAAHLKLPVTLLPLLGALVGNDFSSQPETSRRRVQSLFFDKQLSLCQRIDHAANTMRSVLLPTSQRRKLKYQVGGVMDLIDRTVNALLARVYMNMGSGEIDAIVENIVEATLQYAIPKSDQVGEGLWSTPVCALHQPEVCPLLPMISRRVLYQLQESEPEEPALLTVREVIMDAYRNGSFSPKIMDVLNTASSWPKLFLENPDFETVSRSMGRPIRTWLYSILDDAVGLLDAQTSLESEDNAEEIVEVEEDGCELIDVIESDSDTEGSDYLAPLKGELERLHPSEDEGTNPPSVSSHRLRRRRPPIVTEYIRRGTRIASEIVTVPPLGDVLDSISLPEYGCDDAPMMLRPEADKLTVLLRLLKSDTPAIRNLPREQLVPVLVLRWVATTLNIRAQETGSKEREKERWTITEGRCFLASFSWSFPQISSDNVVSETEFPVINNRHIQLAAQALTVIEAIEQLSQVLLLSNRVPSIGHLFSGKRFYSNLNVKSPYPTLSDDLWSAVSEGLSNIFQEEWLMKTRKTKKNEEPRAKSIALKGVQKPVTSSKGFYGPLGEEVT